MKNKMLVVAYFFPPYGGVGSFRITKLIKYFTSFGWDITVVTVKERYYDSSQLDYNKINDIPSNVKIIRTNRWNEFTRFKEEGFYWCKDLYFTVKNILKKNKFDYIFYTGGPFFHFSIAPRIKKISNIPYILDFRDPWLLTPYNSSKLRKIIASVIEPRVIKNAYKILNVTEDANKMYISKYKNQDKSKFLTISNGYDPDDFKNIHNIKFSTEGMFITYAGKLGGFRDIIPFLNAIKDYNKINNRKIYFIHVGKKEKIIGEFLIKNKYMRRYIIQTGFISYNNALAYIKASDIALIISGGHPYEPTTKIYDYIALDKRILCINDIQKGYLYNTISDYKNGVQCKNNVQDILKCLNYIKVSNETNIDSNKQKFNRKYIFENLNNIILKR